MSIASETINTDESLPAKFPLDFQDFVSENIATLGKFAYEQAITRNRNLIVASYQCLSAARIDYGTDGEILSIQHGQWSTRLSRVALPGYKQHLINLYGKQEAIEEHIAAAERILDLINPDKQCLLYLQQGIFLPEHHICWNDERLISNVLEFPVSLSEWYKSTFVTATRRKPYQQTEQHLENELFKWLQIHGVEVERQVTTKNNHRLDLWIPGRMMLELKAGKVTGDDVCARY